jgi:crotonobetainyl-CoA:carnitine CoA-transferase CaiB-like acyl-CoA transferase
MSRFFLLHTKSELEEGAAKRGMKLIGVQTVPDIMNSKHLNARGYWKELNHPELNTSISYPGYYFQSNKTKHGPKSTAPHLGEHNKAVYKEKLGLSAKEVEDLKLEGVI